MSTRYITIIINLVFIISIIIINLIISNLLIYSDGSRHNMLTFGSTPRDHPEITNSDLHLEVKQKYCRQHGNEL